MSKVVSIAAKSDIEQLRKALAVEGSPLEANIGRTVRVVGKPGLVFQAKHIIVGVQKIWDYDENGAYRFGVEGYTIQQVEPITLDTGEQYTCTIPCACSVRKIEFVEE